MNDWQRRIPRRPPRGVRLRVTRTGRSPHEILVCITALIIGGSGLVLEKSVSQAINDTFPEPYDRAYFFGLVLSAALTLYGIGRWRVEGLLIERIGLALQALFFAAYAVAILINRGAVGIGFAAIPLCFTASNLVRIAQIRADLAALPEQLRRHPGGRGG